MPKRVYHGVLRAAIAGLLLVQASSPAFSFGTRSAARVEARLRQAVLDLFAQPERMFHVVPLKMSAEEERKTVWAMRILFRPAKIEELTLTGVTASGHVKALHIVIRDIDVFGLHVERTQLDAEDFDVDLPRLLGPGEIGLAGDARTRMSARVTEADLNRVSPQYKMELRHDDFAVSGRAGMLFIRAGYRLHGSLFANADNQLIFRPKSLSYGFLPIPRALYASQVRKINPVFDMARFLGCTRGGFDLRFERVALEHEVAEIALGGVIHARPLEVAPLPPPPPRT